VDGESGSIIEKLTALNAVVLRDSCPVRRNTSKNYEQKCRLLRHSSVGVLSTYCSRGTFLKRWKCLMCGVREYFTRAAVTLDSPYSPEKDKRRYEQTRRVVQVVISKQLYELVS